MTVETAALNTALARTGREIALMQEYRTRLTADIVTGKLDVREAAAKLPKPTEESATATAEVDWNAVQATSWQQCKEGKQAEFLVEQRFPWELVSRIGVQNALIKQRVDDAIKQCSSRPRVEVQTGWYD